MYMPDVNILVGALHEESPDHEQLAKWMEDVINGDYPLSLSSLVVGGLVRVVTNSRIFAHPMTADEILTTCDMLLGSGRAVLAYPGQRHFSIFSSLCRTVNAKGNLVSDAQHAALAIETNATWVSLDEDFALFPGLKWVKPQT